MYIVVAKGFGVGSGQCWTDTASRGIYPRKATCPRDFGTNVTGQECFTGVPKWIKLIPFSSTLPQKLTSMECGSLQQTFCTLLRGYSLDIILWTLVESTKFTLYMHV